MAFRIKHSLRFKLTMLLMIIMALTIFGSIGITLLSVKTYFVGKLKNRMINAFDEVNTIFNNDMDSDSKREALSKIVARGDITILVLDAKDGTEYTNINEKSKMLESMQALAELLEGKDENDLDELFFFKHKLIKNIFYMGIGDWGLFIDGNKGYYQFNKNYDTTMNTDFYDLTGVLDDGSLIALRSSGARLNDNVKITLALYTYVGVFAIIIGCIAMFVASSFYVKPIKEMAVAAKKMAQLDFDTRVTTSHQDEIGALGASINSMSKELETTISELKTANVRLAKDIEKKNQRDEKRIFVACFS